MEYESVVFSNRKRPQSRALKIGIPLRLKARRTLPKRIMAPPTYNDARSFLTALTEMAEELRQVILSMSDDEERSRLLMKLVAESDMVFGVWPDPDASGGVGIQIIKGEEFFPPLVGFETADELAIVAIPCADRDVALAARDIWGSARVDADCPQAGGERTSGAELSASQAARLTWASTRLAGPSE